MSNPASTSTSVLPLLGVAADSPYCYLLEYNGFRLLLDCGIDYDKFNKESYSAAMTIIIEQGIDCILISHSSINHIGGLPYLMCILGLMSSSIPIYVTIPIWRMGQMELYDIQQNYSQYQSYNIYSLDDIDNTFDSMKQLKYSQEVRITHKTNLNNVLSITPYPAGHSIGGTNTSHIETQSIINY
jgi:cleavage and polyadenylation specificity factor subunit 2